MAAIEKDDYAGMLRIGQTLKSRLGKFGVNVEAPKPEPWEKSNLAQPELDKILGKAEDSSKNPEEIPKMATANGGGHPANLGKENLGVPEGMVDVQIPGHPVGHIPKSKLADFKKKHPNAQVL